MPIVTVVMAMTAAFVLLAPLAMAAMLVRGPIPLRRVARVDDCRCAAAPCACAPARRAA